MERLIDAKWCGDCKSFLSVVAFAYKYPQRAIFQTYCKICQRRRSREHYLQNTAAYKVRVASNNHTVRNANRARVREYLSAQQCMDCGLRDLAILEFDHRDPAQKTGEVSTMFR